MEYFCQKYPLPSSFELVNDIPETNVGNAVSVCERSINGNNWTFGWNLKLISCHEHFFNGIFWWIWRYKETSDGLFILSSNDPWDFWEKFPGNYFLFLKWRSTEEISLNGINNFFWDKEILALVKNWYVYRSKNRTILHLSVFTWISRQKLLNTIRTFPGWGKSVGKSRHSSPVSFHHLLLFSSSSFDAVNAIFLFSRAEKFILMSHGKVLALEITDLLL